MKEKFIAGIKVILFVGIGAAIFLRAQDILKVKYEEHKIKQFYALEENTVDAVFLGTSHMENAYSPMQVFEDYGLSTYNLASPGQPIEMSYLLAEEAVKKQSPTVIVLDASNLFIQSVSSSWRRILDTIPYSDSKMRLAKVFEDRYENLEGENLFGVIVPFYRYHDRWKELSKEDFYTDLSDYSIMGSWLWDAVNAPWMDVAWMNEALAKKNNEYYHATEISNGNIKEMDEVIEHSYEPKMPEENLQYLRDIKALCDEAGVELIITKIPSISDPEWYASAWTEERSAITRQVCETYGIAYVDMLYDELDYALDPLVDFYDGGMHMNVRGALKISDFFGKYLQEHYDIQPKDNVKFYEKRELYDETRDQALLRTEQNFGEYLNRVSAYKESGETILMVVSADMIANLDPIYVEQLRGIGLQMDYQRYPTGAYVVCIQDGEIAYEVMSGLNIKREIELEDATIEVDVTGTDAFHSSNIEILYDDEAKKYDESLEDKTYHRDDSNFTFLVYDEEDNEIRDCASFGFQDEFAIGRAS